MNNPMNNNPAMQQFMAKIMQCNGNPEQAVISLLQDNQNLPMANQLLQLAQSGNTNAISQFANNYIQSSGNGNVASQFQAFQQMLSNFGGLFKK